MANANVPVLKAANGRLDIQQAFSWSAQQIPIEANPAEWLDPLHNQQYREGVGGMKRVPAPSTLLAETAEEIIQRIHDQLIFADDHTTKDLTLQPFCGTLLDTFTVFDLLGWLLSVTARPLVPPNTPMTDFNFYLPLCALFAKWCATISHACKQDVDTALGSEVPPMVSIAYWTFPQKTTLARFTATPGSRYMLLGATLGAAVARTQIFVPQRQRYMTDIGYRSPGKNFGKCAESLFFIFVKGTVAPANFKSETVNNAQAVSRNNVPNFMSYCKGFAVMPAKMDPLGQYSLAEARNALRDPCDISCQQLFSQIDKGWSWTPNFAAASVSGSSRLPEMPAGAETGTRRALQTGNTRGPPSSSAAGNPSGAATGQIVAGLTTAAISYAAQNPIQAAGHIATLAGHVINASQS